MTYTGISARSQGQRSNVRRTPRLPEISRGLQLVMLLSDGFGGFGGIAKFNRDFLEALDASLCVERVHALPRLIPSSINGAIPESVIFDRHAAAGKVAFVRRTLSHVVARNESIDVVVCGHVHLLSAAWTLARVRKARLALIVHGIEAWARSQNVLANLLAGSVDSVIAVSQHSAERFASWSKVPMSRVFVLPNCVDLNRFRPEARDPTLVARYGLESNKVILTVGRLASEERYKGFDEVIDVLPQLLTRFSNLKYLVVGDGPDRARLEDKARAVGVSAQVVFAGRIPEPEKVAHYSLADAYVMPSSGEGFGIVLIEAAACGLPIVGSLADGSREALLGGRLGKLVDPRDQKQLLQAVTALLVNPVAHRRLDGVANFSVERFRTRVATWIAGQALAGRPTGAPPAVAA